LGKVEDPLKITSTYFVGSVKVLFLIKSGIFI
jgi:hypothetical protein